MASAKAGANSSSELSASEQSYCKILLNERKDNVREFEQQEKALQEIFALISDAVLHHDILRALRKRL